MQWINRALFTRTSAPALCEMQNTNDKFLQCSADQCLHNPDYLKVQQVIILCLTSLIIALTHQVHNLLSLCQLLFSRILCVFAVFPSVRRSSYQDYALWLQCLSNIFYFTTKKKNQNQSMIDWTSLQHIYCTSRKFHSFFV